MRLHVFDTAVLLFTFRCLITGTAAFTCFQQADPRDAASRSQIDCSPTRHLYSLSNSSSPSDGIHDGSNSSLANAAFTALRSPLRQILLQDPLPAPTPNQNYENMFEFTVTCDAATSLSTCQQMNKTMIQAGQLISNVLALSVPIYVNVTLYPFCQAAKICSNGTESLAAAAPARTIALIDDDDIQRLYPQSVVKQFGGLLTMLPEFSQYDINLNVNSEAPFYFSGSGTSIKSTQTDLLYVVLHELFHGLGFTSSYEDYFHPVTPTTLSPNVLLSIERNANISFSGFIEYAFDRRLTFQHGFVTDLVTSMNDDLLLATRNRTFDSADELSSVFDKTAIAGPISRSLKSNFTTPHTTAFTSAVNNATSLVTLETSILPFSSGSSISHMASDLYDNTPDFLMRFISLTGLTLDDTLQRLKKSGVPDIDTYGAIGPGLRGVMSSLGYRIRGLNASTITTAAKTSTSTATTSTPTNSAHHTRPSHLLLLLGVLVYTIQRYRI